MARIQQPESLKWNIISPCMALLINRPSFITKFSIRIQNDRNGGNGIEICVKGMFLGHSLFLRCLNSLT
jgi:hypothetical protein